MILWIWCPPPIKSASYLLSVDLLMAVNAAPRQICAQETVFQFPILFIKKQGETHLDGVAFPVVKPHAA